jgi:hypothetical protein
MPPVNGDNDDDDDDDADDVDDDVTQASKQYMLPVYMGTLIPFGLIYPMVFAVFPGLFADVFDTSVRYSGTSFVYQLSR